MAYGRDVINDSQHISLTQAFSGIYTGATEISALLMAITDTLPLGFYVVDARSDKIVYFNERFCDIWHFGHLADQMRDGRLNNQDISPEIVRQIDGSGTISSPPVCTDDSGLGAGIRELRLLDGRTIRRFAAPISYGNGSSIGNLYAFEDITEQARAQEKIRKSNERYKELADSLPQIVFEMDMQGDLTFVNRSAITIMGIAKEDFERGINVFGYIAPEDHVRVRANMDRRIEGGPGGAEYTFVRKDGTRLPVIINSEPVFRDGRPAGYRGIVVDISEQKKTEARIRASLREKEVLLKEVHHRVRNNMQIISSLLSLQMVYAADPAAIAMLRESQNRIRTIALVHEKLYNAADLARVELRDYLERLAAHLTLASGILPGKVRVVVGGDEAALEPNVIVPCGLILSELLMDSLKRASNDNLPDEIHIDVQDGGRDSNSDSDRVTIIYTDNGPVEAGRAKENRIQAFSSRLVLILVEQLEGTFRYDTARNAMVIEFPVKNKTDKDTLINETKTGNR